MVLEGVGTSSWMFFVYEIYGMIVLKDAKDDVFPYPIDKSTFDSLFPVENLLAYACRVHLGSDRCI